jgi:hypothetical protein
VIAAPTAMRALIRTEFPLASLGSHPGGELNWPDTLRNQAARDKRKKVGGSEIAPPLPTSRGLFRRDRRWFIPAACVRVRLTGKEAVRSSRLARETGVRQQNLSRWLAEARRPGVRSRWEMTHAPEGRGRSKTFETMATYRRQGVIWLGIACLALIGAWDSAANLCGRSGGQRTEADAAESGHRTLAVASPAVQHGLRHHSGHAS